MKLPLLALLVLSPLFISASLAQTQTQTPAPAADPANPVPPGTRVRPGETKTNPDGVRVENPARPTSKGDTYVDPEVDEELEPGEDPVSTVTVRPKSKPKISGIDGNDKVIVNRQGDAEVTGKGGSVRVDSGGKVKVTNEAGNHGDITITTATGTVVTVSPGNTATVSA